ncbi:hypothetical protein DFH29DRAFT_882690 [Suillus ampliporus]|nr:hypothetical protein DFH29DRAFT_882690 [Suillus ampliporus]
MLLSSSFFIRPVVDEMHQSYLGCNIKVAFEKCSECIRQLLCDHPEHLHFAMDAWTSLNHHAFVAWTVRLKCEGKMFSFVLNIIEVAEQVRQVSLITNCKDQGPTYMVATFPMLHWMALDYLSVPEGWFFMPGAGQDQHLVQDEPAFDES